MHLRLSQCEMKKMINKTSKTEDRKRFVPIRKINSNSYGGSWIAAGIIIGVVLPALVWFVFHVFLWWQKNTKLNHKNHKTPPLNYLILYSE